LDVNTFSLSNETDGHSMAGIIQSLCSALMLTWAKREKLKGKGDQRNERRVVHLASDALPIHTIDPKLHS
jgi:hypothetical protein